MMMNTKPEPKLRVAFAVMDEDERIMRILDAGGKEINLKAFVPKDHLSDEQKDQLLDCLQLFKIVFLDGIGRLKMAPYRLPMNLGRKPIAHKPYPIPLIHRKAVLKEVERLVKLGVLEPNKDTPWAALSFCDTKEGRHSTLSLRLSWIEPILRTNVLSATQNPGIGPGSAAAKICVGARSRNGLL